jgi:hypothetical protein
MIGLAASDNVPGAAPRATSEIRPLSLSSDSAQSAAKLMVPPTISVQPEAVQQGFDYVFPQLILGGEWTSTIRLVNRSTKQIPFTNVYFVDNQGNPMTATFQTSLGIIMTDTAFSFALPPGGMIEGTFVGGSSTQFGHAFVALCSPGGSCIEGVYGEVTLRNRNSTRPDFEAIFPLEQPAPLQYMVWDHRGGVSTVLYLVNNKPTASSGTLTFTDTANNLIRTVNFTLPILGSQIIDLQSLVPETMGKMGTLAISGPGTATTVTALRINPSNSFTPIRTFVPKL